MDDACREKNRQLVLAANAVTVALSKNLSANEENVLGNFFSLIGASLSTLAAIDQSCETQNGEPEQSSANLPH